MWECSRFDRNSFQTLLFDSIYSKSSYLHLFLHNIMKTLKIQEKRRKMNSKTFLSMIIHDVQKAMLCMAKIVTAIKL
jgi:hypothetical protein